MTNIGRPSGSDAALYLGAIAGIAGAAALFGKAFYDWWVLRRLEHTGYFPSEPTDHLVFLVPLLLLFTVSMHYLHRRFAGFAWIIAGLGLIAVALWWEAWRYGSGVPTGLLALPGYVMVAGGMIATRRRVYAVAGLLTLAIPLGSVVIFNACMLLTFAVCWDSRSAATIWDVTVSGLAAIAWIAVALSAFRPD
jgi:hypothetical protein